MSFLEFLKSNEFLEVLKVIVPLLLAIILFFKTGSTRSLERTLNTLLVNNLQGGTNMKYRTENYQDTEKVSGQTFDTLLKTYRVNKVSNELEETGEVIDIQEMINSSVSSCLTEVLSRFFPDNVPVDNDKVAIVEQMQDDLDYLQDTFAVAERYKEMLGLSPETSVQDVFKAVQLKSQELSNSLTTKETNVLKEDKANAQEIIEESKQA